MKIAEYRPEKSLVFKAFQDGANSYGLSCTYIGQIQYKLEFSSFDALNDKWNKIKATYEGYAPEKEIF